MLGIAYYAVSETLKQPTRPLNSSFEGMRKAGDIDDVGGTFLLADIRTVQGRLVDAVRYL